MTFRFRRSTRLGPLRFNFSKGGLSWSMEHNPVKSAGLPNSRRLRPGQLEELKRHCLDMLNQRLFAPGCAAHPLWDRELVSRVLSDGSLGGRDTGLFAVIETPEAMEAYLLRARSEDDTRRRANRCIASAQQALRLAVGRGWALA